MAVAHAIGERANAAAVVSVRGKRSRPSHKTVAEPRKSSLCCPAEQVGERTCDHGQVRRTGHDQEIRQPAALQHRHQHLRDARRPRRHGEGRRGFRRSTTPRPARTSPARCWPRSSSSRRTRKGRTSCRSRSCASSSASTATACRCWCRAISKSRSTRSPASRRSSASR